MYSVVELYRPCNPSRLVCVIGHFMIQQNIYIYIYIYRYYVLNIERVVNHGGLFWTALIDHTLTLCLLFPESQGRVLVLD